MRFIAGHVPGIATQELQWQTLRFDAHGRSVDVAVPALTATQTQAVARHVREHAQAILARMQVSGIIEVLDRAVARLLDARDPLRIELDAVLPVVTGFDPEMVRLGLTAYLQAFRGPQLHRFVAQDFANPKVLDEFQPALKGGMVRAFGPRLLVHSWSGNWPGLPLWSLACGLLVKGGNVGKLPSAEPVFASLFARALVDIHPPLADCFALLWWKGGDHQAAAPLLRAADTVLAYGGNPALQELRDQVPATTRFLAYGHKIGLALVGVAALDTVRGPATARRAALDIARFEQQGCHSPHVVYAQRGGAVSPQDFAHYLAAELANLEHRSPRRVLPLEEAAAVARWRESAEWGELCANGGELLVGAQSAWAVAYSPRPQALAPSAGQRCITVSAVDTLDEVIPLLVPHAAFLQTAGLATTPAELHRLAGLLGAAGITRIAPIGAMTQPEAGWHHDGRFNLADLVRMVEIERAAEDAADGFADYAQERS